LGIWLAQPSGSNRTQDVEKTDDGDGPAGELGGEAAVDQVCRKMHCDEKKLESAGEEAEHQKHIAAVPKSLGQCL